MNGYPISVWALVLIGAIGIPASTAIALQRGAVAAGLGRRTATGVAAAVAAVFGGWLVITAALAGAKVYVREGGFWFGLAFAGVLVALLLATRIPLLARILAGPGTASRLAVPHTLRVAGIVFLILMAQGRLPAAFALPAGLGDIAIGIAAPFVARRLARAPRSAAALSTAVRFNLLGILDLAVALTLGVLLGPPWLLGGTPSTEMLRLLPLALIPTAAVPLAITLHIVSLQRLRAAARVEMPDATTRRPRGISAATRP
jgi:hypothetical protein